jgi:hypothetical protein
VPPSSALAPALAPAPTLPLTLALALALALALTPIRTQTQAQTLPLPLFPPLTLDAAELDAIHEALRHQLATTVLSAACYGP